MANRTVTLYEMQAIELIEKYNERDPFELCSFLDVSVIFCSLPVNINGFCNEIKGVDIIT